jgi:hypothetical protein
LGKIIPPDREKGNERRRERGPYALSVPADDPATPGVEGGRPGDSIVFYIGGLRAEQTAVWRGGTNTRLDLTAVSARVFLPLVSLKRTEG